MTASRGHKGKLKRMRTERGDVELVVCGGSCAKFVLARRGWEHDITPTLRNIVMAPWQVTQRVDRHDKTPID